MNDPNFLQAFLDITGMSKDVVIKAFTFGQVPILHDFESTTAEGQYDYSVTHDVEDLHKISISKEVLVWFENADRNPNTIAGLTNLFYMSSLVGHEGAHWGSNIKNAGFLSVLNKFCNPINGVSEHGKAFEPRMYILNLGPSGNEKPRWGIDSGNIRYWKRKQIIMS